EKVEKLKELVNLTDDEAKLLLANDAPVQIENIIGVMTVPIGMATNFTINGKDRFITFAVEEASVVAAASNAARMARPHGGFFTSNTGPFMIGQIQVLDVQLPSFASQEILSKKEEILKLANEQDPILVKFGGGASDVETRIISTPTGDMLIVHLIVNCLDAMGANAVNTMVEACAPMIEKITGGTVRLRIISNLADRRIIRARAVFDKDLLGGIEVVEAIVEAWAFAEGDPYRAATHNKGIMNAISAITLATANDWRAIEAGAHAYAAKDGYYHSLTTYEITEEGNLAGTIELPLALGTIGGATKIHPIAQVCLKIMEIQNAIDLAEIVASAGLAQNLAALRALTSEGIQAGHMKLHAKNLAASAGAVGEELELVAKKMVEEGKVRMDRAEEILKELRG
ncbi:MAG: hydroxymethylglutaryl-CoA reductase, degradative, partial [Candidatus Heimdallarchaeota archaeon]|nr:hydroxymethylglutaryl-CoA reductase, degradative [Candidatus Heimdallarchaeota archaeon]